MNKLKTCLKAILRESVVVEDEDAMISIINTHLPHIKIEINKGQKEYWWGNEPLPFDYGELPEYINPADDGGWDIIIAPDSKWNQPGLRVAGIIRYKKNTKKNYGKGKTQGNNSKLILAFNGQTTDNDKKVIKDFFKKKKNEFQTPEFFDKKAKTTIDEDASTTPGWEGATFKQYKLTRVADDDYVGMGVGRVARETFHGTWGENKPRNK